MCSKIIEGVYADADEKLASNDSVISQIANDTQVEPAMRAYYLLKLASLYLVGGDRSEVERPFGPMAISQEMKMRGFFSPIRK